MGRSREVIRMILVLGVLAIGLSLPTPTAFGAPPQKVPQVDEAIPSSAEQGTVNLDVTIIGKNFDDGSIARFFLTGTTNPDGITVHSTGFENPRKLIANITIDLTATVDDFDIEVERFSNGRKGKGTEKFSVLKEGGGGAKTEVPLCALFRDVGDLIRSDALGDYCHDAEPNLRVAIGSNLGMFNLWTDNTFREVILEFPECASFIPDPSCSTDVSIGTLNEWVDDGFGNLVSTGTRLDLDSINYPNGTAYVDFQAAFPSPSKSTPHLIVFGGSNQYLCGEPALVTRLDVDNWVIEASTQDACFVETFKKGNRRVVHDSFSALPFKITMTRQ